MPAARRPRPPGQVPHAGPAPAGRGRPRPRTHRDLPPAARRNTPRHATPHGALRHAPNGDQPPDPPPRRLQRHAWHRAAPDAGDNRLAAEPMAVDEGGRHAHAAADDAACMCGDAPARVRSAPPQRRRAARVGRPKRKKLTQLQKKRAVPRRIRKWYNAPRKRPGRCSDGGPFTGAPTSTATSAVGPPPTRHGCQVNSPQQESAQRRVDCLQNSPRKQTAARRGGGGGAPWDGGGWGGGRRHSHRVGRRPRTATLSCPYVAYQWHWWGGLRGGACAACTWMAGANCSQSSLGGTLLLLDPDTAPALRIATINLDTFQSERIAQGQLSTR